MHFDSVKLFINFLCKSLFYDSGCQPLNCNSLLLNYALYCCTGLTESVMHNGCVMFCPCPTPIFKMFMISEMIMSTQCTAVKNILLAIGISEIQCRTE